MRPHQRRLCIVGILLAGVFAGLILLENGRSSRDAISVRRDEALSETATRALPPTTVLPAETPRPAPPASWERPIDFGDPKIPLTRREAALAALGDRGDAAAAAELVSVAERGVYLSSRALEELGRVRRPEVVAYLRQRVAETTSLRVRELSAAAVSLLRLEGEAALPDIERLLVATRSRDDGLHEDIQLPLIDALAHLRGARAAEVLARELSAISDDERYDIEIGGRLVTALEMTGEASAASVLTAYADILVERSKHALETQRAQLPRDWDEARVTQALGRVRHDHEAQIARAKSAAERLRTRSTL